MAADTTPWSTAFHPRDFPSIEQKGRSDALRDSFSALAAICQENLPENSGSSARYKAMVKTKLEEAAMLATKAFTHG